MNKSLEYWKAKLSELGLVGLNIVQNKKSENSDFVKEQYSSFDKMHSEFIKYIAKNHIKELQYMKLVREDIVAMFDGVCPENTVLILKVLPEYGGRCDHSNILLMPKHNAYDGVIRFYQEQMADNDFDYPENFYNLDYQKSVYYPNYSVRHFDSKSIPERIEELGR